MRPTNPSVAPPCSGTRGFVQVGVLEDYHRRFSTQFKQDRLPMATRHLRNLISSGFAASEVELSDTRMGDQCVGNMRSILRPMYDGIKASRGEACLPEYFPLQRSGSGSHVTDS
jgi:hypothetical protein